MKERVSSNRSQLLNPKQLILDARVDLYKSVMLANRLFIHQLKAQYRRSLLGYLWLLFPALTTTVIWSLLNQAKIIDVGETDVPYPLYVLAGISLWQLFVDSLNSPLRKLQEAQTTLTKINYPVEALLISGTFEVLFHFLIRLILLLVVMVLFQAPLHLSIMALPLGIASLLFMGIALGIWLAIPGLFYQDVGRGLSLITSLWFFITPIVYPSPAFSGIGIITRLNPVTPLLTITRDWLLTGNTNNLTPFLLINGITLITLVLGWFVFRLARPHIIERLSA